MKSNRIATIAPSMIESMPYRDFLHSSHLQSSHGLLLTAVSGQYKLTATWTGLLVPNDIITPKSSGLTFATSFAQGSFKIICLGLVN